MKLLNNVTLEIYSNSTLSDNNEGPAEYSFLSMKSGNNYANHTTSLSDFVWSSLRSIKTMASAAKKTIKP
jgi:hypothetical protein